MSVAEAAHRPAHRGRALKLWLGFLIVILGGLGLAWAGAESVKSRVVQVTTVQPGSGPLIQPQDGVLIEYTGKLENGTVFDSTEGKGPAPLLVGQVIPGFAEGLTRMQQGGRYKLHIPSDLAYGANPPSGGPIPPNADLEFDIHVVQVAPNAAAMMQGGAPQQ
ncbi:FKBP-type peptidyl-prolyl cis-trans isomerase [Sphingomonas hankyongi]|uniref:Peptidyl-prolyl cis-trans isomerase n=1 Tax=Sphingomonas hankyongi TaxID=2908209 RepID=A0ABT0S098_9SPHN|nr:FKBP-type peptidyl-prolyl cis-trans isomerase [Sphingomonas hankyongi]MCL6729222.1 FKBP-type peptidyl-prolyl cis-trans isomerase [Sphingomonas hankyongi]